MDTVGTLFYTHAEWKSRIKEIKKYLHTYTLEMTMTTALESKGSKI